MNMAEMVICRAMVRILQLLEHHADFESRRAAEGLARSLGAGFEVEQRTMGYGGTYRDLPTAAATIRRAGEQFDLVHAWGGKALTVAALATRKPIVFSPPP